MSKDTEKSPKRPTLFRNYVSFFGMLIVAGSLVSIVLLVLLDFIRTVENPYHDLVTFIMLPSFLILGIVIALIGVMLERRRRRLKPDSEIQTFPRIDLN